MLSLVIIVLAVAYIIAMWYAVFYIIKKGWGPYLRSKRQTKTRVEARIKDKLGKQELNPVDWQMEIIRKVLVFECEDGVERDYDVRDDVWDWVEEGDDGVLVYQGDLFIDFEARRPRHDLEKAYKNLTRS